MKNTLLILLSLISFGNFIISEDNNNIIEITRGSDFNNLPENFKKYVAEIYKVSVAEVTSEMIQAVMQEELKRCESQAFERAFEIIEMAGQLKEGQFVDVDHKIRFSNRGQEYLIHCAVLVQNKNKAR